jgi:Na+-translocating ferredoxin:NAD+ oxidoreductase subunit B
MIWLDVAIAVVIAIASFFGASFLSTAWRKLKRTESGTQAIALLLPGYDCGLCGHTDCRAYAAAIDKERADPALCIPGGSRLETLLRALLSERPGDPRAAAKRAVVRCGGRKDAAVEDFPYDGRPSCRSAVEHYGGPKRCKEGCLGFGSCAAVCPVGAIRVVSGLAVVNPDRCTGCGQCVSSCPTGIIDLIPRGQSWYVACSSRRAPEARARDCSAACSACGDCSGASLHNEFSIVDGLAKENPDAQAGHWEELAEHCPRACIVLAGKEKKRSSPFPANGR